MLSDFLFLEKTSNFFIINLKKWNLNCNFEFSSWRKNLIQVLVLKIKFDSGLVIGNLIWN
jgi:hypothetical protein